METVNLVFWYLNGASVVGWAALSFAIGMHVGRISPNRHRKILQAEIKALYDERALMTAEMRRSAAELQHVSLALSELRAEWRAQ